MRDRSPHCGTGVLARRFSFGGLEGEKWDGTEAVPPMKGYVASVHGEFDFESEFETIRCRPWDRMARTSRGRSPWPQASNSGSQGYHRSVPVRAHAAQQRRVHNQFSERIDCRHVEGREPADAADVDREVKAVAIRGFHQRAQRCRVNRPVDEFNQFFVLESIDDAKQPIWPLANARQRERLRPIGFGEPVSERRRGMRRRS